VGSRAIGGRASAASAGACLSALSNSIALPDPAQKAYAFNSSGHITHYVDGVRKRGRKMAGIDGSREAFWQINYIVPRKSVRLQPQN
jgi:hypothetical protein